MSEFSVEYGRALYLLAKEENTVESTLEELLVTEALVKENKDYIKLIDTPAVPLSERLSLIDTAFSGCSLYVKNFLKLLAHKKCFHCFSKCVKEFNKLYDEENNIERAEAVSCVPLSEAQLTRLKEKTEKIIGKTVFIENRIDKSILGGVILKLKNVQYDGSVKTRLDSLADEIKGNIF